MTCVAVDIGVHSADAERMAVQFAGGDLVLTYVDWRDEPQRKVFVGVLGFRFQEFDEPGLRDDRVYEVTDSEWLARQCELQAVTRADHAHYKLCFNACGTLDVLCRRDAAPPSTASTPVDTNGEAPARAPVAAIHRGEVFWLGPDDARGPAPRYAHPHVVVQDDVFNHARIATVVVCALTSNLHRASEPGNVLLDVGEGGLPAQSVVVVSQVSSVDKARLGARIGSLSDQRVDAIVAGLRFQQVSFFARR